jgi:hypothetical protein
VARGTTILVGLLVATNAAWAWFAWKDREARPAPAENAAAAAPASDAHQEEVATLKERIRVLESEAKAKTVPPAADGAEARLVAAPARPASAPTSPAPRGPTPEQQEAMRRAREQQEAQARAKSQVDAWKADVVQILDPARRESGLVAIESAMRSPDPALATTAFRSLWDLRDATYDKSRFREAVRLRLEDPDRMVRSAAGSALLRVEPDSSDYERLLKVAEAHPEDTGLLIQAAWLAKNRVEGRLADLYVKALGASDSRDVANQLRGMWVTAEVEDGAIAVFRRSRDTTGWWHILGQIQPTREPRLRLIFEVLKTGDNSAEQLLERALEERNVDASARALAADLAVENFAIAPTTEARRIDLRVLAAFGRSQDLPALRSYAVNTMVAEDLRRQVAEVIAKIESRR